MLEVRGDMSTHFHPWPLAVVTLRTVLAGLLLSLAGSGCNGTAGRDLREERDPMIQRALVKKRARDIDGAIDLFYQSLEKHPRYARPDLELGVLYDEFKEDYIRAIFHYERYLKKRPTAEKGQLIEELVRTARLSYAASLPHQPSGAIEEIRALKEENRLLRNRLDNLMIENRRLKGDNTPLEPRPPREADPVTADDPPSRQPLTVAGTYVVQGGDTLSKIARKVYSDSGKWQKIYDANRATMASPQSLNVGQTLIIPRDGAP